MLAFILAMFKSMVNLRKFKYKQEEDMGLDLPSSNLVRVEDPNKRKFKFLTPDVVEKVKGMKNTLII